MLFFQQMLMPYLDHFGLPYSVIDINKQELPASVGNCPLIIIAHDQMARQNTKLLDRLRTFTQQALDKGCGLVSFDLQIPRCLPRNLEPQQLKESKVLMFAKTSVSLQVIG